MVLKPRKPILFLLRTFRQNVLADSLLQAEQVFLRQLQVGLLAIRSTIVFPGVSGALPLEYLFLEFRQHVVALGHLGTPAVVQ
jgi:hypothetical protein